MKRRFAITDLGLTAPIGCLLLTAAVCSFSRGENESAERPAPQSAAQSGETSTPRRLPPLATHPRTQRLPPLPRASPDPFARSRVQLAQYKGGEPVAPVMIESAEGAQTDVSLPAPMPRVTDSFVQTDIQQAIISLGNQAGVSVVLDERVAGITSAIFDDEPFDAALRKVLLPLGYVYRFRDGQYLIGVPDPKSALFPLIAERYDFLPRHRSAEELVATLPAWHRTFARANPKREVIVIDSPPEIAQKILADLERSDVPAPQVVLEAVICVYSPEDRHHFGFDISQEVTIGSSVANLGITGLALSGHSGAAGLNHLTDFRITSAFLRALEQRGVITIRAAPRVMAQSGEKAMISIGRETYFSVQPLDSSLLIRQDIEKVDAGISLDITPIIRGSNVTVNIERAEVSEDIRSNETKTKGNDNFPIINRRLVATTVEVLDGNTIVIGGLRQRQEVEQVNKIPWLGDLPYIGWLFRRIDRQDQESEVAVFISPRIVHSDVHEQVPFVPEILPESLIYQPVGPAPEVTYP